MACVDRKEACVDRIEVFVLSQRSMNHSVENRKYRFVAGSLWNRMAVDRQVRGCKDSHGFVASGSNAGRLKEEWFVLPTQRASPQARKDLVCSLVATTGGLPPPHMGGNGYLTQRVLPQVRKSYSLGCLATGEDPTPQLADAMSPD